MTLFSRPLRLSLTAALVLPALLAGCASEQQPTHFAPLRYDYLSQMNLNVSTLSVVDNTVTNPVPGDIGARAPTPPVQAVRQMVQDRLAAASNNGSTAQFVIDRASILHNAGGTLNGQIDVHLDILNPGGTQAAHAEAHVSSTVHPDLSKGDADSPANLYEITQNMMQRMNVELEYQVRHSLSTWLVDAGGTPVGSAIQTQQLGKPGESTPATLAAPAAAATTQAVSSPTTSTAEPASPTTEPTNAPITTPKVEVPNITTPKVDVPGTEAPQNTTAPAASPSSSEPDPVFPAGEGDDSTSSTAKPKTLSPKPSYLKVPTTKSTTSSSGN
ncbi:hypothetical protein [Acetobacter senegalensis]|uniref:hypothetical protein n=1 Tax=Acetobacter senegalensis TaxID=446692 RepID=UPI00264D8F91|nr:hypothetical protein [Acetobacter senegalensis]MDN7353184.1 hypothetical protein [Acetobacter senegalensis]